MIILPTVYKHRALVTHQPILNGGRRLGGFPQLLPSAKMHPERTDVQCCALKVPKLVIQLLNSYPPDCKSQLSQAAK